ncbi:hypothetical protein [Streptomyces sp. NPDC047315]|uniref:hypothetical protein n=1 Tax=Streptomyces sp. NPDC047315 TaxID=3155142 RepID=UPI0033EA45B1
MAGTTRTRKTAASKAADATTDATTTAPESHSATAGTGEEPMPAADTTSPPAPDAAPLEPPAVEEPPAPPAPAPYATPTEVIPDDENLAEVIIDDETNKPPTDAESVFAPLTEYGSLLVCGVRLVERTFLGPHRNPVHRLLQPKGAHVSEGVAQRILERLRAQQAKATTEADQ